jgi:hypothetical protein
MILVVRRPLPRWEEEDYMYQSDVKTQDLPSTIKSFMT